MSVTLGAPQASAAGFVTPKGPYKVARAMSGSLALTPNGEFPLKDRGARYFLAPVPRHRFRWRSRFRSFFESARWRYRA